MLFGPKIGNAFFQNLMGNHSRSTLTIDLWFMRTWGRYTGTLVKGRVSAAQVERLAQGLRGVPAEVREALGSAGVDPEADYAAMAPDELVDACRPLAALWEGIRKDMLAEGLDNAGVSARKAAMGWPGAAEAIMKGLARSVDQPERAGDRRWMRAVTGRALDILATRGYRMSAADLQATLWYPERSLWAALSGRKAEHANVSFDEALADMARRKGYDDDAIERARLDGPGFRAGPFARRGAAVVQHGAGGRGDPGSPGRGLAGGGEGHGREPDGEDPGAGQRLEAVTEPEPAPAF